MDWDLDLTPKKEEKTEKLENDIPKKKKVDIFKVMTSALSKNYNPSEEEIEKIPEFLFHQWLSNEQYLIDVVAFFTTHNIPIIAQYKSIRYATPKMFLKYPKKSEKDKNIELIMDYYKCSKKVAEQYLEFVNIDEIKKKLEIKG